MGVVFDVHAHCFPPLGERQPGEDMELRLRAHQYHQHTRGAAGTPRRWGVFRIRDNVQLHEALMLGEADGESWMPHVDFRIAPFGRTEFTHEGEDYRIQWLPPTMVDSSSPPDLMIAQMDYVGVNKAIIQHDRVYGRLDDYLADCMKQYPDRFAALAQVDEWIGGQPEQIERVRHQIEDLGFSGLYFATEAFFVTDFSMGLNDRSLEPLWDLVGELGVPVFWYTSSQVRPKLESYLKELRELTIWARNHPHIPAVLTHALDTLQWNPPTDPLHLHSDLIALVQSPNMQMELFLLALTLVGEDAVTSDNVSKLVLSLIDELGVEKLLWGSDMPCCERHLPYIEWLDMIRQADFLTPQQIEAMLGDNLEGAPGVVRPSIAGAGGDDAILGCSGHRPTA